MDALAGSEAGVPEIQPPSTALQQNAAQRARFELGGATDEADFEARRQTALLATTSFYDAEQERINALGLNEEELQDEREDNQLAREMAVGRLTNLENTFTQQRLANEMAVQREAERTAATQEREAERAATAAAREETRATAQAERAATQTQRETERATVAAEREAERAATAAQRATEQAQQATDAQAGREAGAGASLLQTGVGRAQFALGQSGSEAGFEQNRQDLINATNDFYDNELARINELMRTEIELQALREANQLARDRALDRAINTDNDFTEQRIRNEMDAVEEAESAAEAQRREQERTATAAQRTAEREASAQARADRDALRAAERTTRERQRIAERQQREEERFIQQRIREEMRLTDALDDLRDDALDAEMRRSDALVDLEQDTQDRILDIQRNANRSREDVEREFQDAYQDIQQQRGEGTLTDVDANAQLLELGRERIRDLRDVDIRTGRRQEDAGIRQQRGERDIGSEASERLFGIQQETAELETTTALTQSETAATESETAAVNATTAVMTTDATQQFADASVQSIEASMGLATAGEQQILAAEELQSAARVQGLSAAAKALSEAAGGLSTASMTLQEVANSLGFVSDNLDSAVEAFSSSIEEGGVTVSPRTQIALAATPKMEPLAAPDITEPVPVEVANPDDMITQPRGEDPALAATDMLLESDAPTALMQTAPPMPEAVVQTMNVTAGTVNVSGGVAGAPMPVTVANPDDIATNVNVQPMITP